jgi:glucose-6-phosphate isomerase
VFVQSVIWNLNAFDQWGVEIGKQLSGPMFEALCGDQIAANALDQSSQHIIQHIQALSGTLKPS